MPSLKIIFHQYFTNECYQNYNYSISILFYSVLFYSIYCMKKCNYENIDRKSLYIIFFVSFLKFTLYQVNDRFYCINNKSEKRKEFFCIININIKNISHILWIQYLLSTVRSHRFSYSNLIARVMFWSFFVNLIGKLNISFITSNVERISTCNIQ